LLITIFLTGCSKKAPPAISENSNQSAQTTTTVPFQAILIESPEAKDINALKKEVGDLVASNAFDQLDGLAKDLRNAQECYVHGVWKLTYFYEGLDFLTGEATDSEWTNHLATLKKWVQEKPDSVTARVAFANGLIDYAWFARGHNFADKVPDEEWKLFFERLNEAVVVLKSAKNLEEQCPCCWAAMLRAELGLQTERSKYDTTFNAAVKAWPNYTPFYFIRANFLLPRWYGADGELAKDLEQSANQVGGDKGDMLYAQVIWNLESMVFSKDPFGEYHFSWERANKGLEAIKKRYPDSLAAKNEAARMAAQANDFKAAKTYFDETAGQIDLFCWSSTNEFVDCAEFVYGNAQ
jgi:hypothetical protein